MESLKGQLLLAAPTLFDPNFRRAVVLVTEHNEEGAAGLVLNRRSQTPVTEAVPDLAPLVPDDVLAGETRRARVFAGYAGWGPGQLEAELEESSWIVEEADRHYLFPTPEVD